jgi:hypothetical protein
MQHLRVGEPRLRDALADGLVWTHPFIVGEVACGNLRNRREILDLLEALPKAALADHDETLQLLEIEGLYHRGIGWVDVHLIASARISSQKLWTLDRRLATVAAWMGVGI